MRVELPVVLDAEWIEESLPSWVSCGDALLFDLGQLARVRLFAEGRLLGALAQLRDLGREVEIVLDGQLPAINASPRDRWWRLLRDEAAAVVLVNAAQRVRAGTEEVRTRISDVQHHALHAAGGEVKTGHGRALIAADDFRSFAPMPAFEDAHEDHELLHRRIEEMAADIGVEVRRYISELTTFAREAVENTREHARRTREPRLLRLLVLRRLTINRAQGLQATLPTTERGPVHEYLDRLSMTVPPAESSAPLLELTVADAGPGIAVHLSGDPAILTGPFETEAAECARATLPGVSSKVGSITGRGSGLANAIEAAESQRGLVVIRSGRAELVYNTIDPISQPGGWQTSQRTALAGTSISLLLPMWSAGQERLGLQ